jgi:hypothetical protein
MIGNLVLLFSFLLAMVPRSLHDTEFIPDYVIRSFVAGLMLMSILMARWIWKIRNPLTDRVPAVGMRVVLLVAWAELAFAIYMIVGLAILQLFRHYR